MADKSKEILEAIVVKLRATSAVTALVSTRIYKGMPNSWTAPAVGMQVSYATSFDTKDATGQETFVDIDVWSRRDRDADEANSIMSAIVDALHRASLTITGVGFVKIDLDNRIGPLLDEDGLTSHGVVRMKVTTLGT